MWTGTPELLDPLVQKMSEVLTGMEVAVRPENSLLLRQMAAKLSKIVEDQDQAHAAS